MTEPTDVPEPDRREWTAVPPADATEADAVDTSSDEPTPLERADDLTDTDGTPDPTRPAESQTDILATQITGPDDHVGMAALWRLTMDLPHWWFIAVGEDGLQSPAAADIGGQLMLLTFTDAERARHFAVGAGMITDQEPLAAIALPPQEIVESAQVYADAGIDGLMFDPQLAGYFIPTPQLPVVWDAVHSESGTSPEVDPNRAG